MNESTIQINKGCYSIDTEERREWYMAARAFGNEEAFREYRKRWDSVGANGIFKVDDYPISVEFCVSDACNLKCPFCYRNQPGYKGKNKKFMNFDLFKKVIDEIKGKVPAVRFNSTGESVLNPDFVKMIKYAKDNEIIETSFITNAGLIDERMFERILLAGMDWITVSVDGMGDTYDKLRYPLKFEETYRRLKMMKEMKAYYGTPKPAINIQAIWPYIADTVDEFMDRMTEVSDYINYVALMDHDKKYDVSHHDPLFLCQYPFQRLLIYEDGSVMMCCGTERVIGNANTESIHAIWHGEKLEYVRSKCSATGGYLSLPECKVCIFPVRVEEETAIIKGENKIITKFI